MKIINYRNKSFLKEHFSFDQAKKINPKITKEEYFRLIGKVVEKEEIKKKRIKKEKKEDAEI